MAHERFVAEHGGELTRNLAITRQDGCMTDVTFDHASLHVRSLDDPEGFWLEAASGVDWITRPKRALDASSAPLYRWFPDARLNTCYNALDRHVITGRADQPALIHDSAVTGTSRTYTYAELLDEVARLAGVLQALGAEKGDRVVIYMPMIAEAVISMLACARIGAVHSVVFGGFSADALRTRIADGEAKVVITADGGYRRGKPSALKPAVDEAVSGETSVQRVLVVKRTGEDVTMGDKDMWWDEALEAAEPVVEVENFDAEHPLFILYTSGTTGKPKGIFHTSGGYLTQAAYTNAVVHDVHPDTDVYWCTADVGWITGHSYITYGPLANGATQVMYEGTPDTPHQGRWWEIIADKKVSIFYTAPTAIRTCMKWGEEIPQEYDLSSIRVLGSVGEPINPEAWMWFRDVIGAGEAPIVDTWWQTETGAIMISPLPGVTTLEPGSAQRPVPGISAEILDDEGKPFTEPEKVGYLVLTKPWPSMLRGIWGDPDRYRETYWSRFGPEYYFAGDGAKYDADGNIWLLGRVDDVMNVSGHRLSTAEIESALVSHPAVAEAAVVGASDEMTGQAVCAFVILRGAAVPADGDTDAVVQELRAHVGKEIGPIAKPRSIMVVTELPKTRSGKIMRRLLRDLAEGREVGDATTLADSSVMQTIQQGMTG